MSGKPLGFGTCTYNALDAIYTGTWLSGKMNGQGQFVFQKSRYTIQGTFKDGKLQGEGQRSYSSGKTIEGFWDDN